MISNHQLLITTVIIMMIALASCGQKGPLQHPPENSMDQSQQEDS
ncbi:MAG: lipoprotein [Candidatus Thiodiazotropha sp. 6PLUC1]